MSDTPTVDSASAVNLDVASGGAVRRLENQLQSENPDTNEKGDEKTFKGEAIKALTKLKESFANEVDIQKFLQVSIQVLRLRGITDQEVTDILKSVVASIVLFGIIQVTSESSIFQNQLRLAERFLKDLEEKKKEFVIHFTELNRILMDVAKERFDVHSTAWKTYKAKILIVQGELKEFVTLIGACDKKLNEILTAVRNKDESYKKECRSFRWNSIKWGITSSIILPITMSSATWYQKTLSGKNSIALGLATSIVLGGVVYFKYASGLSLDKHISKLSNDLEYYKVKSTCYEDKLEGMAVNRVYRELFELCKPPQQTDDNDSDGILINPSEFELGQEGLYL